MVVPAGRVKVCVEVNCLRTQPEMSMDAAPVVKVSSVDVVGPWPQASDEAA